MAFPFQPPAMGQTAMGQMSMAPYHPPQQSSQAPVNGVPLDRSQLSYMNNGGGLGIRNALNQNSAQPVQNTDPMNHFGRNNAGSFDHQAHFTPENHYANGTGHAHLASEHQYVDGTDHAQIGPETYYVNGTGHAQIGPENRYVNGTGHAQIGPETQYLNGTSNGYNFYGQQSSAADSNGHFQTSGPMQAQYSYMPARPSTSADFSASSGTSSNDTTFSQMMTMPMNPPSVAMPVEPPRPYTPRTAAEYQRSLEALINPLQ